MVFSEMVARRSGSLLTRDDVYPDEGRVVLHTRKKRSRSVPLRSVTLTGVLRDVLTRLWKERDPDVPWVFRLEWKNRKTGLQEKRPYSKRSNLLKKLCARADVTRFGFHSLRRSGATVMDEAGVAVSAIQRILGHGDRRSTERYLKKLRPIEIEAMAIFEQACGRRTENHTQTAHTA
ncbi:integrase family protein [Desulfovibrio sp. X2]|uniref:tyrosine-type recombinase/integrase n=1 Tax=Desulfovibrio sp. X2 TaxID=941449 RepID=UPI000358E7AC|nr:tyrosine-type recombinase/integrase [Desulfovibrio sp. X2]EPR43082.1 integrase family protein [Desulfovibrio sp. X2]